MNEFDQYQQIDELKALREMVPSWQTAKLEPFVPAVDSDIRIPVWNKARIEPTPLKAGDSSSAVAGVPVRIVVGVQEGGSFVPKIVTVSGTVEEIP